MKEGDHIIFWHKNNKKSGIIIKIYTQIGYEDHGEKFAVIRVDNESGLFNNDAVISIKCENL